MGKYEYTQPIRSGKPDNYVLSIYIDGKQHKKRISKKYDTNGQEKLAKDLSVVWLNMLEKDLNPFIPEDVLIYTKKVVTPTVKYCIDEYVRESLTSPETITSYKAKLKVLENLYDEVIKTVTKDDINNELKKKIPTTENTENTYSNSTLKHAKTVIKSFFEWAVDKNYITSNPVNFPKNLKSTKNTKDGAEVFTDEHFKIIIHELRKPQHELLYNYAMFVYHLHLRPKEIRFLIKSDVDINRNLLTVRPEVSKVDKKDIIDINSQITDILINKLNFHDLQNDDYLFGLTTKKGVRRQISDSYVSDRFRQILKDLKLYEYSLYSFKGKGNVDKFKGGWKLEHLAKLNRHSSIETTIIYLKKINKVTEIAHLPEIFI